MSAHTPKTRALMAYQVDALTPAGRRRLEAHLEGCEVCREELASARLYDELSGVIREAATPEIRFDRMELALRREARRQARSPRTAALAAVALAAAAAFALFARVASPETPTAEVPRPSPARVASAEPQGASHADGAADAATAEPVEGMVLAVTGEVDLAHAAATDAAPETVELSTAFTEGDVLTTGLHGSLHARVSSGTGFVLATDSSLGLERLRADGVSLALRRGRVSSAVRTGTAYEVRAGDYTIVVRGTRFAVSRHEDRVHVSLAEGVVAVERGGRTLEVLHAPAEWGSTSEDDADGEVVERPVSLEASPDWPAVRLPPFPNVDAYRFGDARFEAAGTLNLRAPVGELTLFAIDRRGREHELTLEVLPEGLELTEAMLPELRAAPRRGELSAEEIRGVVRTRQRALRRCYERVLRRQGDPALTQASYSLRVDVGPRGDVRRVNLSSSGGAPNTALSDCITHEVRGWTFPAPRGGPVSFSLPLNLSAR